MERIGPKCFHGNIQNDCCMQKCWKVYIYFFYLKMRSTEELTRLLTPIIEDCVKRNMEALLSRLRPNLMQDFNSNQLDQQNINDSTTTSNCSTRPDLSLVQPESRDQRRPIRGRGELSEELGKTVSSLGLDQTDKERVWQQLGCGISLQDFYIGKNLSSSSYFSTVIICKQNVSILTHFLLVYFCVTPRDNTIVCSAP